MHVSTYVPFPSCTYLTLLYLQTMSKATSDFKEKGAPQICLLRLKRFVVFNQQYYEASISVFSRANNTSLSTIFQVICSVGKV